MIRALIFDCFGVLYRQSADVLYDLMPPEKRQAWQDIVHACDHGFISRADYFEQIAELLGKNVDDIRQLEQREHTRNEPLFEYIKVLKQEYKIGLLSNIGNETMDRLFSKEERHELFDAFILSSEVGLIKPAREIFEVAANQLQVPVEECVMIDDLLKNVEGAQQAGMKALLFTTNGQLEQDLKRVLEAGSA
jgi:putative hydrolase of the HAD superfamily